MSIADIRYDENDVPNKYGVTRRYSDIFYMAQDNIPPDDSFTPEELEEYNRMMNTFKWCDKVGRSRESVVLWYND